MPEGTDAGGSAEVHQPTVLKALLRERRWQSYRRFRREYVRIATELDRELAGTCPSDSTYRRWLSGRISGIPRAEPCAVLERMFPGYTAEQLFKPCVSDQGHGAQAHPEPVSGMGGDNPPGLRADDPVLGTGQGQYPAVSSQLDLALRGIDSPGGMPRDRSGHDVLEALSADLADLRAWIEDMKRRELLRALGSTAVAVTASAFGADSNADEYDRLVGALATPSRVDEAVIGHIEEVLWSVMRQDDALGPQAVLSTVIAQRGLIESVLPECPTRLRPRLLSVFANTSRFAGWLSFDLGSFEAAQRYYEEARAAAHEAENTPLGIMTLCNMSHLAVWRRQPRVGIDHALAAQGWAATIDDAPLRAYAADVSARAFSADHNRRACSEALDRAHRELTAVCVPHAPATSLAYFYGEGQFNATRSECMVNLDEPAEAVDAAIGALELINPAFVRNHAFSRIYLADARAASGEVDEAAQVLGDSAELAARNRSPRLVARIRRSRNMLAPGRDSAALKTLDERLTVHGFHQAG